MMRLTTVIGTRPEFIRASCLSRALAARAEAGVEEQLINTGQHYDYEMAGVFFEELHIRHPDVDLGVGSGPRCEQIPKMVARLKSVFSDCRPDVVIVHGDTNSTLSGALAAKDLGIPIAHVEAGLRCGDMAMVEEQNRIETDRIASLLYCPTTNAVENLKKEGITEGVKLVGDLSLDACLECYTQMISARDKMQIELPRRYFLLTIHRAENTDDPARLGAIIEAINGLGEYEGIFPVHPRTRQVLASSGLRPGPHIRIIPPVGFLEMLALIDGCSMVLTDSGGVQKEAYLFQKPCITLRDSTEWVETVSTGWNAVVGTDVRRIREAVRTAHAPVDHPPLYGKGNAAELIAGDLIGEMQR